MPMVGRMRDNPSMINDLWYKNAIIYCLSVGTYMDANGDGIGDFQGLMRRLDYLHGLGVTAIWLMPFQVSPLRDDGYDISDYYGVDPRYGTIGDFVEFTHGAKQRGIRVLIDLVVNHTSNEHQWFKRARRDHNSQISRLVRMVEEETAARGPWHGVSRRAEVHVELRRCCQGLVLPSFLRFPTRSQYLQPRSAGGNPKDHGLLDSARRFRVSDGCGAVCDRHQGAEGQKANGAIRNTPSFSRIPAVASGRLHYSR